MCGKWYRGTVDWVGWKIDSESAEKGLERVYRIWTPFSLALCVLLWVFYGPCGGRQPSLGRYRRGGRSRAV